MIQWRIRQGMSLQWLMFGSDDDGERIVFHTASGQTHVFNELAYEILHSLHNPPADSKELMTRLSITYPEIANDHEFGTALDDVLNHLDILGLIYPDS